MQIGWMENENFWKIYVQSHRAHASSERAFYMGFGVPLYFCIMRIENTATLRDLSKNSHATLCIQH